MLFNTALIALSATLASANNLWIADYGGLVTTAALTEKGGSYSLTKKSTTDHCGPAPSWLTIDTNRGLMFCLNEGLLEGDALPNGSISSFTINGDASLEPVKNGTSILGPVSGLIYGNPTGQRGLVAAHYLGSAVTTWLLNGHGAFEHSQDLTYTGKGPLPEQDAPHPHEAIMDPTGQYILAPDLGLDVVHIYTYDKTSLKLTEIDSLKVSPGTGPRHAVFWNPSGVACDTCTTFMFLVGELAGDVTSFAVSYGEAGKGMTFKNVTSAITQPDNERNAPAELQITPDGRFLIVSNRDNTEKIPDSTRSSLTTYPLREDGTFGEPQLTKSDLIGSGYPRHFSLNKYGNLVAVGLQYGKQTVILQRNTSSGEILSEAVAKLPANGQVTNVMWDEW